MKKIMLLFIVLILVPVSFAQMSEYNLDFTISLNKVYVVQEIESDQAREFNIDLPGNVNDYEIIVDHVQKEETNNFGKEFVAKYVTKKFIDNNNFVMELVYPEDIKRLSITLTLPNNLEILEPIEENTLSSNAIFPKASRITSDGQRIKIIWEKENVKANDSIAILVKFKEKKDYSFLIYLLIAAAAIIILLAVIVIKRKPKIETVIKTRTRKIEEHLKEDEAQIVRILKSRERQCEQGTLRVITGFSKAKLSGLLKELEDRNIIHKEKRGKKNIVFLR